MLISTMEKTITKNSPEIINTLPVANEVSLSANENDANQLDTTDKDTNSWVLNELEHNAIIKAYWSLDTYLSIKLLETIENAMAPDNKWVLHIDYRTRLKWLENILKIQNNNFGWSNISVNFFSSPKKIKH